MHPKMPELLVFFNNLPAKELPDDAFFREFLNTLEMRSYDDLCHLSTEVQDSLADALKTLWLEKGYEMNPINFAAHLGLMDMVKALRTLGFNAAEKDSKGCTALHHAAFSGDCDLIALLIRQHGLNPKDQDNLGETVLDWAKKGGQTKAISFCTQMDNLVLLQKQYAEHIKKIAQDLQKAAPLPLPTDINAMIASYLAPSDKEHTKLRLLERIQKIQDQEDLIQSYDNFHLACLIAWACAGSMFFAIGVTAMIMAPLLSVIPIAVMVSLLGAANLIGSICSFIIDEHPKRYGEEPINDDFATLSAHASNFNEYNNFVIHKDWGGDIKSLMTIGVSHSGGLLFLGLVMLTLSCIFPLGIVPLYFGLTTSIAATTTLGLTTLGLFKNDKSEAYDKMQEEINAIPGY